MRLFALYSLLTLPPSILAQHQSYSPFANPIANEDPLLLGKRQSTCGLGETSCSTLGSNECCASGQNCQLDQAGNVACCPYNVVCTGTIGVTGPATITSTATATTSGFVIGGTTTSSTTVFQTPVVTGVAGGGSTVPNTYFPFIYIPTSYANAALCSSAWTSCQSESTACLASLAGKNGVTVSGFGFGVTVTGQSGLVLSSASSVCSTLSASACYGLTLGQCNQLAGAGARPTACPGMVYAAGAVAGAVGALM